LRTITLSEIIRVSPMSCCFLKSRKLVVTKLSSVASGWVDSCITTTEMPHELTTVSVDSYEVVAGVPPAPKRMRC
jgi:hypothetical protein